MPTPGGMPEPRKQSTGAVDSARCPGSLRKKAAGAGVQTRMSAGRTGGPAQTRILGSSNTTRRKAEDVKARGSPTGEGRMSGT